MFHEVNSQHHCTHVRDDDVREIDDMIEHPVTR